ncbi:MAG: DUF1289 domain-containing protein [Candidatus Accumulibacter sp.]|jgi:hypothetical protein|nr:DUF1289 domain-containing protein [Accumulibacter sp.]
MDENTVDYRCVGVCKPDEAGRCVGCGRPMDEEELSYFAALAPVQGAATPKSDAERGS